MISNHEPKKSGTMGLSPYSPWTLLSSHGVRVRGCWACVAVNGQLQMRSIVRFVVVSIVFVCCHSTTVRAECSLSANRVVEEFFRLDREGYRLSSEGHQAIWQLTQENGNTPDRPVTISREWHVLSSTTLPSGRCKYLIKFVNIGTLRESPSGALSLIRSRNQDVGELYVDCQRGRCRISISPNDFEIPPHPGRSAVLVWLKKLESIQDSDSQKRSLRLLIQQVSALPE